MNTISLAEQSKPFLDYLDGWMVNLPDMNLSQAIPEPGHTAIVTVDVTRGFCYEGPLSSPRVATIVAPIVTLYQKAWQRGLRHILLTQDTHEPEAVEFAQWPPHCVRDTAEAQTVDEIRSLPFFNEIRLFEKNSISSDVNSGLSAWVAAHPEVDTFIVTGDCTDLCTYQLAMYLRLDANDRQLKRRVIVPANTVQTYDLPLDVAGQIGAMPHPGDLIHAMFLWHMQLNGVEIVREIL
jgi:nicotinamidase-related amidase